MNRGRTSICHLSHQMKVSLGTTCHAILHNAILHRNCVQELLLLICHNVYSSVNESLILYIMMIKCSTFYTYFNFLRTKEYFIEQDGARNTYRALTILEEFFDNHLIKSQYSNSAFTCFFDFTLISLLVFSVIV
jgi:hypothetical protein